MTSTAPDQCGQGRPALLVLVGPAGAGKSTLRPAFPTAAVVSLDETRARLSCCSSNQDPTLAAQALAGARSAAGVALAVGRDVLWDATSSRAEHRRGLVELAGQHRARAVAVLVLPRLEVVLARNARRDPTPCPSCGYACQVPAEVVQAMHDAITGDLDTIAGEGWNEIRIGPLTDRAVV